MEEARWEQTEARQIFQSGGTWELKEQKSDRIQGLRASAGTDTDTGPDTDTDTEQKRRGRPWRRQIGDICHTLLLCLCLCLRSPSALSSVTDQPRPDGVSGAGGLGRGR